MSFFKVLSNLNHNGDTYAPGTVIEESLGSFKTLVDDKVLEVMEDVETMAEAVARAARENRSKEEAATEPEEAPRPNTWGAQPDEQPKAPEETGAGSDAEKTKDETKQNDQTSTDGKPDQEKAGTDANAAGQVGQGDLPPDQTGDNL